MRVLRRVSTIRAHLRPLRSFLSPGSPLGFGWCVLLGIFAPALRFHPNTHLHLPAFHSFWCNPETQSGVKSIFSFVCSFPFSGDTLLLTIPDEHHPPHISRAAARSGVTLALSPNPARQSPSSGRREESCYSAEWGWYPTHIVHWSDVPHQKPRFPQAAHVPPDLPPVASPPFSTTPHQSTNPRARPGEPAPRPAPLCLFVSCTVA